ncbi:hypothetical protein GQ44DRAFT_718513 [Phaeosphaeriaceae sp. PMI808]|nr:hypothetical protein GQ44DRAFT_718513 [Phaeosphaeriaceae sp. PMI808]
MGQVVHAGQRVWMLVPKHPLSRLRPPSTALDWKLKTVHQNTISTIRSFKESSGRATKISSSGVDGRVVIWS